MAETGKRMTMGGGMVGRGDDVAYEPPGRDFFNVVVPAGGSYEDFLVLKDDESGHEEYAVLEP
jgi:hypothetical protein